MSNFIRVLRNGSLFDNRTAAIDGLKAKLAGLQDGEICLASYGDDDDWSTAKTVLGVVRAKTVGSETKRSYTIFDNEDIAGIMAKIQELDANVTSTGDSHVTVNVVEVDGKVTAVNVTTSDIASAAELGTKGDASTVDTAFGRIQKEVEDRATAITNAINALANVAISGSADDVANAAITGGESQVAVNGTNVKDQISSIATTLKGVQNSIAAVEANALKYRTVKLSDAEVTALSDSNVKEAYKVVSYTGTWGSATDKATVGDVIKIYKDSSVKEIYLGSVNDTIDADGTFHKVEETIPEADLSLNYAYMKADGTYEMAKINVANFLRESEFKNGLQVNSGVVSVKVDADSEGFLTVGEAGVKVSGVQDAINTAINGLKADVTGKSTDGHVTVQVIETAGEVTAVNVTTSGLALDSEVIKGVTVNGVNAQVSADKKAIVTINGANTAVSDAYVATEYAEPFETKVGTNHIAAGDTVDAAFKKTENTISVLATEVISNEKVTTAAVSKLAESAGVDGADGVIGYQKKTDANYISAATSVHDATVKLDAAIKTVADSASNALTSVVGSNAIEVSTKASNSQTVSLKLDSVKTDNALTVTGNGLYLSNVWDCGEY